MDINVLAQLLGTTIEAAEKLEQALGKKDKKEAGKIKKFILKMQDQIRKELK